MNDIEERSKRVRILQSFKHRLRLGKWTPGSRLPTRTELVKTFKISPMTLQNVIDDLTREGFVQSRGREGTFAAETPPFTRNFGVVLGGANDDRHNWVHYWRVIESEVSAFFKGTGKQPHFYYGIERALSPDMVRLREEVDAQKLAGVFFSDTPSFLFDTPLLNQSHTPLVSVASKASGASSNLSFLTLGTERFFDTALKQVAAAGRTRVGLITPWEDPRQHLSGFRTQLKQYGLETQDQWCQFAPHSLNGRLWSANAAHAIVAGRDKPDALIIFDDNHIESVMIGLQAAGCDVPAGCLIVAHTNFPWPIASPYPLIRVGIDIREIIQAAITEIERRQKGEAPKEIRIPLHCKNELTS